MGPRLTSRGKMDHRGILHPLDMLQWGRGSRAAEKLIKCVRTEPDMSFNGAAAHEPRKRLHRHAGGQLVDASMGPRLTSRGKGFDTAAKNGTCQLQWGRGSRAAEKACLATTGATRLYALDCEHAAPPWPALPALQGFQSHNTNSSHRLTLREHGRWPPPEPSHSRIHFSKSTPPRQAWSA